MLSAATLVYLAIPYFIFFLGWLRLPLAIPMTILLCAAVWGAVRQLLPDRQAVNFRELVPGSALNCAFAFAFLVTLLYISGISGFGFQTPDWEKHFAIVNDLARKPWPVLYPASDSWPVARYLTYYFAYYIPAASIAFWGGPLAGDIALFVWTLIGSWLSCLWVSRLCGSCSWLLWTVWFVLGGMDIVGILLHSATAGFIPGRLDGWWAGFGLLPGNPELLLWVPQHMLAGWLTTGLVFWHGKRWYDATRSDQACPPVFSLCILTTALSSLWSPFITIGLVPLLLLIAWRTGLPALFRQAAQNWLVVAGAVAIGLLVAVFLSSVNHEAVPSGWSFLEGSRKRWPVKMASVCLLNFGIQTALVLSLLRLRRSKDSSRTWLWMAGIALCLIPLYYAGAYNDFMMRVSIPALFVMHVMMLRSIRIEITQFRPLNWQACCLAACIILGSGQAALAYAEHSASTRLGSRNFAGGSRDWTIPELLYTGGPLPASADLIRSQYYGSTQSFFFTKLARRPSSAR